MSAMSSNMQIQTLRCAGTYGACSMANIKRLIVIVLFEHVDLLDVTGPAEVFSLLQR